MPLLSNHRSAILAADGVEELELIEPLRALRAHGARVDVIAPRPGPIQGMYRRNRTSLIAVDRVLSKTQSETVMPEQYESLVLPGGAISASALRDHPMVRRFVIAMNDAEKPLAAICHATWILISAGVVTRRRVTSFRTLRDDLVAAGALWQDAPVVLDGNLLTARGTQDLAEFDSSLIEMLSRGTPMISPRTRHLLSRSRIA